MFLNVSIRYPCFTTAEVMCGFNYIVKVWRRVIEAQSRPIQGRLHLFLGAYRRYAVDTELRMTFQWSSGMLESKNLKWTRRSQWDSWVMFHYKHFSLYSFFVYFLRAHFECFLFDILHEKNSHRVWYILWTQDTSFAECGESDFGWLDAEISRIAEGPT